MKLKSILIENNQNREWTSSPLSKGDKLLVLCKSIPNHPTQCYIPSQFR